MVVLAMGPDTVLIGGRFSLAGSSAAQNLAMWDKATNKLSCLLKACGGAGDGGIPQSCCESFSSDVRMLVGASENRVVVGGDFIETDVVSGVVSSGLAVLEHDGEGRWWRQAVMLQDAQEDGTYGGVNGAVVAASCHGPLTVEGECDEMLLGGWFDSVQGLSLLDGQIHSQPLPVTTSPFPLAKLHIPTSSHSSSSAFELSPVQPALSPSSAAPASSSSQQHGINAIITETQGTVVVGGFLPNVGHLGRLTSSLTTIEPALANPYPTTNGTGNPTTLVCLDQLHSSTSAFQNEVSFCCRPGSLCPYLGMSVMCPDDEGYLCLPTDEHASCCPAGQFCPTTGVALPCTKGYYCPEGSMAPNRCQWYEACPHDGMSRPLKAVGAMYASLLLLGVLMVIKVADGIFVWVRHLLREKRKRLRREHRRANNPRGSPKRRVTPTPHGGPDNSSLQEPLLSQGGGAQKSVAAFFPLPLTMPPPNDSRPPQPLYSTSSASSNRRDMQPAVGKEISLHFER